LYREADARSDVYSLAAVLYYALAYNEPERPDPTLFDANLLPFGLRKLLVKAIGRRPEVRPVDAGAFRDALQEAAKACWVELTAPGLWSARPANQSDAEWVEVTKTPAHVCVKQTEVYRLRVIGHVVDEHFLRLAELPFLHTLILSKCERLT